MSNDSGPNIISFVIRFIREAGGEVSIAPRYRGAIRHIQSDQETSFTCWADAVEFIQRYIPIEQVSAGGNAASSATKTS